jgi:hypothetical protein
MPFTATGDDNTSGIAEPSIINANKAVKIQ